MSAVSDDFDWSGGDDVVIPEQAAIAVYGNPAGAIVIRQAGQYPEDDDWIVVDLTHALVLTKAILRAAGFGNVEFVRRCGGGYEDVEPVGDAAVVTQEPEQADSPRAKDKTAADRQRRYRERHRNGDATGNGGSHAPTVTRDGEERDTPHLPFEGARE